MLQTTIMLRLSLPLRCVGILYTIILSMTSNHVVLGFTAPPNTHDVTVARNWRSGTAAAASLSPIETDHDDDCKSAAAAAAEQLPTTNRHQGRRAFWKTGIATTALGLAGLAAPTPAHALKKRNEALCGTGFFEHIYEYKCTAIGDIQDEGYSKALNQAESGLTDGLMGKLGLDSGDAFQEGSNQDTLPKSEASKQETTNKNNQDKVMAQQ